MPPPPTDRNSSVMQPPCTQAPLSYQSARHSPAITHVPAAKVQQQPEIDAVVPETATQERLPPVSLAPQAWEGGASPPKTSLPDERWISDLTV